MKYTRGSLLIWNGQCPDSWDAAAVKMVRQDLPPFLPHVVTNSLETGGGDYYLLNNKHFIKGIYLYPFKVDNEPL